MIKNITLIIVSLLFLISAQTSAQTVYNSANTGNWNVAATWQITTYIFVPTPFPHFVPVTAPATTPPTATDYVSINDGHTVTAAANANAASVTVYSTSTLTPAKLILNSGVTLTTDSLYLYPTGDGNSSLDNDGTINTSKVELNTSNAAALATLTNNGAITTTQSVFNEATGTANLTINSGGTYTTSTFTTNNTAAANTIIDLSSGTGVFETSNSFSGNDLTLTGGSAGSVVRFAGTAAITIPAATTTFVFDNIEISNTTGASINAQLTASNFNGSISTIGSGIFNLNNFDIAVPGDINNAGTINANANIDLAGDFISSGTFTSSGSNINLEGDWNNTGTYTHQSGDIVTLDGTSAGASIIGNNNFYELVINKSGQTVSVPSGNQDITSILDLDAGTFNVSAGANVTLLSSASGTAQLDVIEAGATYTGDLVVQRFLAMGNDGWRELTSPVTSTTLANWQDDGVILTGFTGADYDASNWYGWINSWTYSEPSASGTKDNGWTAATSNTNPTAFTNGHRIYIGTGNTTLSVKGAPNNGFTLANVTNGGSGSGDDQNGWNLIGNPYPCTIDWNTLTPVSVDAAYWIWNATAGNYGVYQTGAGSGTNGVDNHIAHSQAFWVHASAASGFLIFSETSKVRNDKAFVKSSNNDEFVRIKLSGAVNSYSDEAILTFNQNATAQYDAGIDQNKLFTELTQAAPSLAITTTDNYNLSIAGVNEFMSTTIPLKAYAGDSAHGNYTIEFDFPENTLINSCVTLEDLETGIITDLKTTPAYSFVTTASSPQDRFLIHITSPFESTVLSPSCANLTDGSIEIEGANVNGNTFTLANSSGVITSVVATGSQISFEDLPSGDYTVTSSQSSACGYNSLNITITNPQEVIASFELNSATIYLDDNATITPQNNSTGDNYSWDFGDGNISFDENPSHTYSAPGTYTITLTVESNGCESTFTSTIEVKATTSIEDLTANKFEVISFDSYITVNFKALLTNATLSITDLSGKQVYSQSINGNTISINTDQYANGSYLINVYSNQEVYTKKVIIQ
ncbi:MAG: PKD domain-containing protein [Flavobacteriales bacterium]|jgi:PKD repeat protein|nr:PKD domain-containing protein [Flavobacteriales bacterium]